MVDMVHCDILVSMGDHRATFVCRFLRSWAVEFHT